MLKPDQLAALAALKATLPTEHHKEGAATKLPPRKLTPLTHSQTVHSGHRISGTPNRKRGNGSGAVGVPQKQNRKWAGEGKFNAIPSFDLNYVA